MFLGRDNSFGRKRRQVEEYSDGNYEDDNDNYDEDEDDLYRERRDAAEEGETSNTNKVEIKEMFRVYESREIIPQAGRMSVKTGFWHMANFLG
jgi:hypothetical protein